MQQRRDCDVKKPVDQMVNGDVSLIVAASYFIDAILAALAASLARLAAALL